MTSIDLAALAEHLRGLRYNVSSGPFFIRVETDNSIIWIIRPQVQLHWLIKIKTIVGTGELDDTIRINPADPDSIERVEEIIRRHP